MVIGDGRTDASPGTGSVGALASFATAFATVPLRRLLLAAAASRFVDLAMLVAVSVALFERSGTGAVAAYGVARTLPSAFGTPAVAVMTGRGSPRTGLASALLLGGLGTAAIAGAVASGAPIAVVLGLVAVTSTVNGAIRPSVTALLPRALRSPRELVATNTGAAAVDTVSTVLGPLLAGAVVAAAAPAVMMAGCAALLLGGAVALRQLHGLAEEPGDDDRRGLAAEVGAGATALVRSGAVRLVATTAISQTFVRGALNVIAVGIAAQLGLGDGGLGLLLGAIGVGGMLGMPVAARIAGGVRPGRTLAVSTAVWGIPLVVVGFTTAEPLVLGLLGVVGVANSLLDIATDTLLQRFAPPGRLAAVMGAFESSTYGAMAVGAAVAGLLLDVLDAGVALAAVGGLLPVVALVVAVPLRHLDETVEQRDAGVALLQLNGIFSPLVLSAIDQVSAATARAEHARGAAIVREGEVGDRFYVIQSGEVEVERGGVTVAVLGPGDCFGEMALLDARPRNATVTARTPVTTRSLDAASFLDALRRDDRARAAAEDLAAARRPESSVDGEETDDADDGPGG